MRSGSTAPSSRSAGARPESTGSRLRTRAWRDAHSMIYGAASTAITYRWSRGEHVVVRRSPGREHSWISQPSNLPIIGRLSQAREATRRRYVMTKVMKPHAFEPGARPERLPGAVDVAHVRARLGVPE